VQPLFADSQELPQRQKSLRCFSLDRVRNDLEECLADFF